MTHPLTDLYPDAPEYAQDAYDLIKEDMDGGIHLLAAEPETFTLFNAARRPPNKAPYSWLCNVAGTRNEWAIKVLIAAVGDEVPGGRAVLEAGLAMGDRD